METMEARSFASRRPAATSLPAFTLPPPDIPSMRYPPAAAADVFSPHNAAFTAINHSQSQSRPSPVLRPPPAMFSSSFRSMAPPGASAAGAAPAPAPAATASSSSTAPSRSIPTQGSSILTPSSGVTGDGLSPSSGIHSGSSQSSQAGSLYYHNLSGSWQTGTPGSSSSAYTFTNPNLAPPGPLNPPPALLPSSSFTPNRPMFAGSSPHLPQFGSRPSHSHSPGHSETLPQPGSFHGQPPFPTQMGGGGGGGGGGPLPTLPSQVPSSLGSMTTHPPPQSILSSQGPPTVTQASSSSPRTAADGSSAGHPSNSHAPLPTPHSSNGYYPPPSSTPHTGSFPAFSSGPHPPNPMAGSPLTANHSAGGPLRNVGSMGGGPPSGMAPPMGYGGSRNHYPPGYGPLPNGPVLANLHSPGAPLTIVGGGMLGSYHGGPPGHGPLPPQIYGHGAHGHPPPHHGPGSQHDRPFKCDTCPQSFNRNHDLKRHKRIHLAVKPYPCSFCDKSFSRKDALKRHRLVKGCGDKGGDGGSTTQGQASADGDTNTPPDRSEIMSDSTEESPNIKPEKL